MFLRYAGLYVTIAGLVNKVKSDDVPPRPGEIDFCKKWIRDHCLIHNGTRFDAWSYGVKHEMERLTGKYVTNGAMIHATIQLGIQIKQTGTTLNADLAFAPPSTKWMYVKTNGFSRWLFSQSKKANTHPWFKDIVVDASQDCDWPRRGKRLSDFLSVYYNKCGDATDAVTLAWMIYKDILPSRSGHFSWWPLEWHWSDIDFAEIDKMPVVYIVRAKGTNLFKIGKTNDIEQRMSKMQTDCPHKLVLYGIIPYPFAHELEQATHNELEAYRFNREWFKLTELTILNNWFEAIKKSLQSNLGRLEAEKLGVDSWNYEQWQNGNIENWSFEKWGYKDCRDSRLEHED